MELTARFEIEDTTVTGAFADVNAPAGAFRHARLERVELTGARLRSLTLTDVVARGLEASGGDWSGAQLRQVAFSDCRLAGLRLIQADLRDVTFRACRLSLAMFRGATLRDVTFDACALDEADFAEAALRAVRFDDCRLIATDFTNARMQRVDLRGSELDPIGGLRGTTIDSVQLAGIAPLLARAAGITVADD